MRASSPFEKSNLANNLLNVIIIGIKNLNKIHSYLMMLHCKFFLQAIELTLKSIL
jgi:hypothetical protein